MLDPDGDGTAQATLQKSYTIGHDILLEAVAANQVRRLLKDGHGSTRALVDALGNVITHNGDPEGTPQVFAYDAYGNPLGFSPSLALTTHLYSGEQTDQLTGLQYLRARYYDPATGTFNRLDPFAGNFSDPQSLHKYLYTHGDPVNGTDPLGLFEGGLTGQINVISTINNFTSMALKVLNAYRQAKTVMQAIETASTIIGLAQADLAGLMKEAMSRVSSSVFGDYASRFSVRGIEEALQTLILNLPVVTQAILFSKDSPQKMERLAKAFAGPKPAFIVFLPTPPLVNPLAALPPIRIASKLGRLRFPVYLSFGIKSYTGMFTGLAVASDCRPHRFDQDTAITEGFFHMDYVVHHPPGGKYAPSPYDLAHWLTDHDEFEFHVPKE